MQQEKRHWGWVIKNDSGETLGFLFRQTKGWDAFDASEGVLGHFQTKAEALKQVLNPPVAQIDIFGRWISANDILSQMTESDFRVKVFTGDIIIFKTNLGQPRHGSLMGAGLFVLAKGR